MSLGNLLTTASSTAWSPFLYNVNAVYSSSLTSSGVYTPNASLYRRDYITGSGNAEDNAYAIALGSPQPTLRVNTNNASFLMLWADNEDPDGSGSVTLDFGSNTKALDSFIIQSANGSSAFSVGGYALSASNDNISFTPLTSSVYYDYGVSIPSAGYDATMMFENTSSYRYYKIMMLNGNGTYGGFSGLCCWDSSLFKNQINLLNPNESNVTASFVDHKSSQTSLEKFTSPQRESFGWYFDDAIGSVDINWGDGKKLFRGISNLAYINTTYFPGIVQYYKSETGALDSWELVSTVNLQQSQGPMTGYQMYFLDIGTPIKTQYLRIVFYGTGSAAPNNNLLAYAGWMYEMSSSEAPPTPTNLSTQAAGNDVAINWTQNSGSDNRLVDIIYNIERSSDNGQNYTKISTLSGSVIQNSFTSSVGIPVVTNFVDTSLADGSYIYRIQPQNRHHLTTGSYATSDVVTVPVPSKKIWTTNKGNIMFNPNDTVLIEIS